MEADENPYFTAGVAGPSAGAGNPGNADRSSRTNSLTASSTRSISPSQPAPAITPLSEEPPMSVRPSSQQQPPPSLARSVLFRPLGDRQQSSIRLRRISNPAPPPQLQLQPPVASGSESEQQSQAQPPRDNGFLRPLSRLRSGSGSRSRAGSNAVPLSQLPTIQDGVAQDFATGPHPAQVAVRTNDGNVAPAVVVPTTEGSRVVPVNKKPKVPREYDSNIVDILDVIGESQGSSSPYLCASSL